MLYIVATPIGNLRDITLRTIEVLEQADVILAEDTRNVANLPVKTEAKLVSFYEENEMERMPQIIEWLKQDKKIALVSNAGTPLISDPGWRLVKKCQEEGLEYTSLPGPCAAINALVLAGLPTNQFLFLGFLPKKKNKRRQILDEASRIGMTTVIYESPFRLKRLVEEIGAEKIVICREMTKKFEEVIVGKMPAKVKGELVLVCDFRPKQ